MRGWFIVLTEIILFIVRFLSAKIEVSYLQAVKVRQFS